jgi:hypothetical protein
MAFNIWPWSKSRSNPVPDSPTQQVEQSRPVETVPQYRNPAFRKHWDKIRFAFSSGGTDYFCWSHDVNVAIERMWAAQDIYREVEWRMNPVLIKSVFAQINQVIFDQKKFKDQGKKLEQISKLSVLAQERLDLGFAPSMDLKFASIIYFDEVENIFDYQHDYGIRKIEHWMKSGDIPAFFLKMPESRLIPGGAELARISKDFLDGLSLEATLDLLMLELVTTEVESKDSENDSLKTLHLQKELALALKKLSANPVTNIT